MLPKVLKWLVFDYLSWTEYGLMRKDILDYLCHRYPKIVAFDQSLRSKNWQYDFVADKRAPVNSPILFSRWHVMFIYQKDYEDVVKLHLSDNFDNCFEDNKGECKYLNMFRGDLLFNPIGQCGVALDTNRIQHFFNIRKNQCVWTAAAGFCKNIGSPEWVNGEVYAFETKENLNFQYLTPSATLKDICALPNTILNTKMICLAIAPELNEDGTVYSLWAHKENLFLRTATKCIKLSWNRSHAKRPCFLSRDLLCVNKINKSQRSVHLLEISTNREFKFSDVPKDIVLSWHPLYPNTIWLAWLQNAKKFRECVLVTWRYKFNAIQRIYHNFRTKNDDDYQLLHLYVNPVANCVAVVEEFCGGNFDPKRAYLFHG